MCGGCRGRYGASATLGQVWHGGSKQEGVQRRCLEREGGWWALHRQQLSFRSGVQSRLMFEMCGGWAELFFLCRIFYFVRREQRTDGRKASSLACVRVAAPLMAILLPAGHGVFLSGGGWGGLVMDCCRMCRHVAILLPAGRGVFLSGGGWGGLAGSILCGGSGGRTAEKRHRWRAGGLPSR